MAFTLLPATEKDFVNREDIVLDMVHSLSNKKERIGYALYGKRRIGKTSILREVERSLKETNWVVPVYFSVWDLFEDRVEEFVRKLTVAILDGYRARVPLRYKAKNLLKLPLALLKETMKETGITLKLQDEIEILLSFGKEKSLDYDELIEDLFLLPEHLAEETKTRCVLLIDEFPSIMEFKNSSGMALVRKIRTISEGLKQTIICISGSIRKTMEVVAFSEVSPFYRQFIVKEIKELPLEDVEELITRNLGREVSSAVIERIYGLSGGVPFYVQLLGKRIESAKGEVKCKNHVDKIMQDILSEEGDILFKEEFSKVSPKERGIIFKMAVEDLHTPSTIAKALGDSPSNVSKFLSYLDEKGVVSKVDRGVYILEDSIFKMWIKKKYW